MSGGRFPRKSPIFAKTTPKTEKSQKISFRTNPAICVVSDGPPKRRIMYPMNTTKTQINTLFAGDSLAVASLSAASAFSPANGEETNLASCSFGIASGDGTVWQQLTPAGKFKSKDGRPDDTPDGHWHISDEDGRALSAMLNADAQQGRELLFDYEHQTLWAKENGKEAPASGWGMEFEWRPGQGLFTRTEFTPAALKRIKDKEYRYISPVIRYGKKTGRVYGLHSAAVTNDPALLDMKRLEALRASLTGSPPDTTSQTSQETPVNEATKIFLALLGESDDITDAAALTALLEKEETTTRLTKIKQDLTAGATAQTALTALQKKPQVSGGTPDPDHWVPAKAYKALVNEMAALKADNHGLTVEQVISNAKAKGKFIAESEMEYLEGLGNASIAKLTATLEERPIIAALTGKQTEQSDNLPRDKDTGVSALTADEKEVLKATGLSEADYLKAKQEEAKS